MPLTNYAKNRVMKAYFGITAVTPPASFWLALFTGVPSVSGGGTEVVGGSYARVEIVNNTTNWPVPTVGQIICQFVATFPTPTAPWGSIVAVGMYDGSTGGNLETFYQLPVPKSIGTGDNYSFPIGNILVRLSGT